MLTCVHVLRSHRDSVIDGRSDCVSERVRPASRAEAAQLPAPGGPPVYRVDALDDTGSSLHDRLGRLFGRPHWIREHD